MADLFLFNESFTRLQYIGFGVVFVMFLVMIANTAIYGVPEKPTKESNQVESEDVSKML